MSTSERRPMTDPQHLNMSFQVSGRGPCEVSVTIEPSQDPERDGQGLLGLYEDPNVVKGFPLLHATVKSLHSRIYGTLYGWVQITNTPGEAWVMDPYPIFEKSDTPYSIWGADPTDVDAPGRKGVKDYDWSARTFLTYTPDAAMTRRVVPILAFTWGFWLDDYHPYVKKLERLDVSCWNDHLHLFRSRFPDWTFDDSKG